MTFFIKSKEDKEIFWIQLYTKKGNRCFHEDIYRLAIRVQTNLLNYSRLICNNIDPLDRAEFEMMADDIHNTFEWFQKLYDGHHLSVEDNIEDQYEEVLNLMRKRLRLFVERFHLKYQEEAGR